MTPPQEDTPPGKVLQFPTNPQTPEPTTTGDLEAAGEVLEGELLSEDESAEVEARLRGRKRVVQVAQRVVALVVIVGESESTTKAVGRASLGAAVAVVQGVGSWRRRLWDAGTMGVYRRQIKAAEATGNQELLAEWIDRQAQAKTRRHKHLMDLPELALGAAKACGFGLVALIAFVLLLGIAAQVSGAGTIAGVVGGALTLTRWIGTAIAVTWVPLVVLSPLFILVAAWREGKRFSAPGWLATTSSADVDVTIDETTIANALAALRIPQITAYLKQGLPLQFITTAHRDGRGVRAVLRLPAGVSAERIAARRADFAGGLFRLAKEVWLTTGSEAGILDMWAANKGALAEGAGPYPLLTDGVVDVFKGVPFGKSLRGEPIVAPLMSRNTITGGMPGQGKSSSARVIMVGGALDPTAELRIWVPDENFDFEAFKPRCSRYVMGSNPGDIAEILAHLRELHAEVQTRGELLVRYETPEVTRRWANEGVGLHPVFCLLEEAHVAIGHKLYGEEIASLLVEIVRLGRKRGIHMIISTQAPTAKSIPRDVTRNCSNGIAFAVGDHVANDALLGDGAYRGGHRATELIPGTDIGTAVVKGFTGQRSEIIQAYFLDVSKGRDQVTPIIKRAMVACEALGGVPGTQTEAPSALEQNRDLLVDLDEVMGHEPIPIADLPALLSRHAPGWGPYKRLTGKQLRGLLAKAGVKVASTGNRWPVDPVAVRRALASRATEDLDDWEDEP